MSANQFKVVFNLVIFGLIVCWQIYDWYTVRGLVTFMYWMAAVFLIFCGLFSYSDVNFLVSGEHTSVVSRTIEAESTNWLVIIAFGLSGNVLLASVLTVAKFVIYRGEYLDRKSYVNKDSNG